MNIDGFDEMYAARQPDHAERVRAPLSADRRARRSDRPPGSMIQLSGKTIAVTDNPMATLDKGDAAGCENRTAVSATPSMRLDANGRASAEKKARIDTGESRTERYRYGPKIRSVVDMSPTA